MPDVTLEHGHTAVLIADFYADCQNSSDDFIRAFGAL